MSRYFGFIFLVLFLVGPSAVGLVQAQDDYLGDAAIYVGAPSERPAPNILLLIDTSRSTLGRAVGDGYDSSATYISTAGYDSNQVYVDGNNDGEFGLGETLGSVTPGTITCSVTYDVTDPVTETTVSKTVDPGSILADYGTYSGAGSEKFPNLDTSGACVDNASKGDVYATGNYLNYINSNAVTDENAVIIEHTYTFYRNKNQYWDVTGNFILINDLPSAPADAEPGEGTNWELYWATTTESPTWPDNDGDGTWDGGDGWTEGTSYELPVSPDALTQREAFYEALVPVIEGASSKVNFGFLAYNPNNQGAVMGYPMTATSEGVDPADLIAALPRGDEDGDGSLDGPAVIASGPNRPQSEALYDAGYYFMVDNGLFTPAYVNLDGTSPNKQYVNLGSESEPNQIDSSIVNICGYNHIILLTNGLPNQDDGTPDLGDYDGDEYGDESVYGAGAHYSDDVAYYLHNVVDLNGDGLPGDVTVHTILAFQTEDELVKNISEDGGGLFYNVFDTQGLTQALQDLLTNIVKESDTAFVAPVVPASTTNRTFSSNKVYLGLFKPQSNAPWHGNLKKYTVSSDNELLDVHGNRATDDDGDFIYSQSYWGTGTVAGVEKIIGAEGLRNVVPDTYNPDDSSATEDPDGGDGGIVDAGGVGGTLRIRDFTSNPRKIYTYLTPSNSSVASANENLTNSQNLFATTNAAIDSATTLDVADATAEAKLINYVHGYDSYGTITTQKRSWILGDILHSKPLVFNYTAYSDSVESTCTDFSDLTADFNSTVIFVGANDGMLHAFRDCDGEELWAFIPPSLLPKLKNLPEPGHEYFVDAPSSAYVHDFDNDGVIESGDGDVVVLIFGLRRGGGSEYLTASDPRGSYIALDVTDPVNPVFLWEVDNTTTNFGELGESWSQPRLHKIMDGTTEKVVMFVGAGYDNNEDLRWGSTQGFPVSTVSTPVDPASDTDTSTQTDDGNTGVSNAGVTSSASGAQLNPKGRGLYVIEVASLSKDGNGDYTPSLTGSGSYIWSFTESDHTDMDFSIPSDLAVIDWDGDGFADRVYAGDTGGQMWRFDLPIDKSSVWSGDTAEWSGKIIFKANPGYTGTVNSDGTVSSSADSTNGRKIFYRPAVARYGNYATLYFGSGDRVHPLNLAVDDRMYMLFDRGQDYDSTPINEANLIDVTDNTLQESSSTEQVTGLLTELYDTENYGWYIRLENNGEKMLAPPVVFFGQVFYTTYAPLVGELGECEVGNLGLSRLYHLDFRTGEAVFNYDKTNDGDYDTESNARAKGEEGEILKKTDRVRTLGEGIPSGIVTLIDASGKVTMMISASNRVGTYQAPDAKLITPVYWKQWND